MRNHQMLVGIPPLLRRLIVSYAIPRHLHLSAHSYASNSTLQNTDRPHKLHWINTPLAPCSVAGLAEEGSVNKTTYSQETAQVENRLTSNSLNSATSLALQEGL